MTAVASWLIGRIRPEISALAAYDAPLPLDEFVKFVDDLGPKKPRKASKLDLAFEAQIKNSKR
jgi:hypothetical protein